MLKNAQEIIGGDVTHAAMWLWNEELSEAEAAAIHVRMRSDPKYREDLDGLLSVIASMEGLAHDRRMDAIARDYRYLLRKRRVRRRLAMGVAAGILVALGAVLAVFSPWPGEGALPMYFTRIGEQKTIQLDDGSGVTLNTGSQLSVEYSRSARRVLLERGEAFFEVAQDPGRPFTVDLGTHAVTALSTAFNVRRDPERYQVAVLEGAVALHASTADVSTSPSPVSMRGPGPRRVEAGWVAEFDVNRNELKVFRPERLNRYLDWRSGMLVFYAEPLHQVIGELNRYSHKRIMIQDASVGGLSVYTTVRVPEIDSALDALEKTLPIRITRHYDRIEIADLEGN